MNARCWLNSGIVRREIFVELTKMQILVTGATGLLGNNVVRELLARGIRPRVLVRETSDLRPLEGLEVERFEGDIRDPQQIMAACQGMDAVVHAAGYVKIGWLNPEIYQAINVQGTQNVAEAVHQQGGRMIHVSTVNTLGVVAAGEIADEESNNRPIVPCPYVESKRLAEEKMERPHPKESKKIFGLDVQTLDTG